MVLGVYFPLAPKYREISVRICMREIFLSYRPSISCLGLSRGWHVNASLVSNPVSTGDGACLLTGPSTSPENSLPSVKNRPLPDKDAVTSPETARGEDDLYDDPLEKVPDKKVGPKKPPPPRKKKPPELLFPFVSMSPAMGKSTRASLCLVHVMVHGGTEVLGYHFPVTHARLFFWGGVSHSVLVPCCVRVQDVSIVRQLLETFVVASREARSLLLPEVTQSDAMFAWKAEDAPRLFDPPGNGTPRYLEETWVGVCIS